VINKKELGGVRNEILTLLFQREGNGVVLEVVDPETEAERDYGGLLLVSKEGDLILGISEKGELILSSNVSYGLGLNLDDKGGLVVHHL